MFEDKTQAKSSLKLFGWPECSGRGRKSPQNSKMGFGCRMGKKSRQSCMWKWTFCEGSVEPMRKVTFRMGSIELSRKLLVRAPIFKLFATVLRRTLAKSRFRDSSSYFRREKLKKGARTSTFRESSIEPMRKVVLQKYLNRDFFPISAPKTHF